MKFTFKYNKIGKLLATKAAELREYIVGESGLNFTLECFAQNYSMKGSNVYEFLSHKVLFAPLVVDGKYVSTPAFVIRTSQGLKLWAEHYYAFENGDVLFTTLEECDEYCKTLKVKDTSPNKEDEKALDVLKQLWKIQLLQAVADEAQHILKFLEYAGYTSQEAHNIVVNLVKDTFPLMGKQDNKETED